MVEYNSNVISSLDMGINIELSRANYPLWGAAWILLRALRTVINQMHIQRFPFFLDPNLHEVF